VAGLGAPKAGPPKKLFGAGDAGEADGLPFRPNGPKPKPVPGGVGVACGVTGAP
jgi:hypothetical protein